MEIAAASKQRTRSARPQARPDLTPISVLAPRLGVTTRSLRYYEEIGLVKSQKLSASARGFDLAAVDRLTLIIALRAVGVSVETLKRLFPPSGSSRMLAIAYEGNLKRTLDEKRAVIAAIEAYVGSTADGSAVARTLARQDLEAAAAASPSRVREASAD